LGSGLEWLFISDTKKGESNVRPVGKSKSLACTKDKGVVHYDPASLITGACSGLMVMHPKFRISVFDPGWSRIGFIVKGEHNVDRL